MKTQNSSKFFHDKPLFGLDIGHGSIKVMQLQTSEGKKKVQPRVIGYGYTVFDKAAQEEGVILQHEVIAKAAKDLFDKHLIGEITTNRVAMAIPAYRTFSRALNVPKLDAKQIKEAVELEADQYIPVPMDQLYLDYDITRRNADSTDLLIVAVPKLIADSYLELTRILGLNTVLIEPTQSSSARLFSLDGQSDVASFIIDFGSLSADVSIFDKNVLVTGTVQGGGINFTESIRTSLGVSLQEAALIKTRYGLNPSKRQAAIKKALEPTLEQIVKEIKRMIRYYEERYGTSRPISQLITLGGGANMPGLSEYLTSALRVAARETEPWTYLNYKGLQPPAVVDKPMYATVAGLSLANPKEITFS
jgi:type IV pilus assembly protein PilM